MSTKTHFLDSSLLLGFINVKFNCIIKVQSRVVSEAYLSNLSFDEDLHDLQSRLE